MQIELQVQGSLCRYLEESSIPDKRVNMYRGKHTSSSPNLDMQSIDTQLFTSRSDVLGSQHGGVGRGLVAVGLDFHATGDTADGFAAT